MYKVWSPYGFSWYDDPVRIVRYTSRGIDKSWVKSASAECFAQEFGNIKLAANHTLVHIAPVADYERYNCNVNGDSFEKHENIARHHTFLKAGAFREHDHDDIKRSFGQPVASAYNDAVGRIEILVDVDNTKNASVIESLENGKQVSWSMSCTSDPYAPVLTNRGYIGISDVNVGDMVMTHLGRWKRVYATMQKPYSGELTKFRVKGIPYQMVFTAEHPFMALAKNKVMSMAAMGGAAEERATKMEWVEAKDLSNRDKLMVVAGERYNNNVPAIDNEQLARLIGYYLAEGSLGFNHNGRPCTVAFTVNVSDSAYTDIPKLTNRCFGVKTTLRPKSNSSVAWSLEASHSSMAEFFASMLGRGCKNKKIPTEVWNSPNNIRLAMIGAWFDGDGWYDKKGGHISTVNFSLALSLRDMLLTVGIPASIYAIDHSEQENAYGDSPEYTVNISPFECRLLAPYSKKVRDAKDHWAGLTRAYNGKAALQPINSNSAVCTAVDLTREYVENVTVYNISVEDDESYLVAGVATHNCRVPYDVCTVCGNEAPSRAKYCKHASKQLGAILKNGHRVSVRNVRPTFFDISQVGMPAEVLAVSMGFRKAASAGYDTLVRPGMSGSELAYQLGLDQPLYLDASLPGDFAKKLAVAKKLAEIEKEIECKPQLYKDVAAGTPETSSGVVKKLRDNKINIGKAMGALRKKNAMLSFDQFVSLTGIASEEKVASCKKLLPSLFGYLSSRGLLTDVANDGTFDNYSGIDKNAAAIVDTIVPRLSLDNSWVLQRMMTAPMVNIPAHISSAEVDADTENVLRKYAAYQLSELMAAENQSNTQPVLTVLMRIVNCK